MSVSFFDTVWYRNVHERLLSGSDFRENRDNEYHTLFQSVNEILLASSTFRPLLVRFVTGNVRMFIK